MLPPFVHSRAMCPARPHRSHLMAGHAFARCLSRAGMSRRQECIRLRIPESRPGRERLTPCRRSYCTSAAANTGQPSARSGRTACTPPSFKAGTRFEPRTLVIASAARRRHEEGKKSLGTNLARLVGSPALHSAPHKNNSKRARVRRGELFRAGDA